MINFSRAPFRNDRLPRLLYAVVAAVLLAVTLYHGAVLTRYLMREQEELDVKVEALQEELASTEETLSRTENELRSQRSEVRTEKIRFLESVYQQKSFSWTGLFNELEAFTPAAVRITSISPSQFGERGEESREQIEIQIQVMARTLEDVLEMVRRLEANQYLTTVLPLSESEDDEGGEWATTLTLQYLAHAKESPADPTADPTDGGVVIEKKEEADGNTDPASLVEEESGFSSPETKPQKSREQGKNP
jgi:Tfp pilus assembly protein PilN